MEPRRAGPQGWLPGASLRSLLGGRAGRLRSEKGRESRSRTRAAKPASPARRRPLWLRSPSSVTFLLCPRRERPPPSSAARSERLRFPSQHLLQQCLIIRGITASVL